MIRRHATNQETDSLRRLAKYEVVWLAMWDEFTPGVSSAKKVERVIGIKCRLCFEERKVNQQEFSTK